MDQELEVYFDNLDEMFGTMGWQQLVEDAKKEIYQLQASAFEAVSFEEMMYKKGMAETLNRIVTLREVTEATRAQHEENDNDASL